MKRLCNFCYHFYRRSEDDAVDTILGCPHCGRDPWMVDESPDACAVNSKNVLEIISNHTGEAVDYTLECVDISVGNKQFTFSDEGGRVRVESKGIEREFAYGEIISYLKGLMG